MKEEPEANPPKKEPECSFCREDTHSYQTCPGLRQMVLEQANELTCRWVAEYEKSQEEAIRHTIQEEYHPATSVLDPWPHGVVQLLCSTLQREEPGEGDG